MRGNRILITGGAGFIGSHLADELLECGYRVRALDNLSAQVHGHGAGRPEYLSDDVELFLGDVRNQETVQKALRGIDAVFHLAAAVGVGQSMYEIAEYTGVNALGTAVLLQELIKKPVERLVIASSMSVYGEGLYCGHDGAMCGDAARTLEQLKSGDWEPRDGSGKLLTPLPTPESKKPDLSSVYALSKFYQEQMGMLVGKAYGIPTVALRFFNVFGPRQALSNPYTGVLAIFASRYLNGNQPLVFEDGLQLRDFVSVYDVAKGCRLALESPHAAGRVFNIGSGCRYSICEIAARLAAVLGKEHIHPTISGKYRVGDIRHCFSDITLARELLKFEPTVSLDEGLAGFAEWLEGRIAADYISQANSELAARGLTLN